MQLTAPLGYKENSSWRSQLHKQGQWSWSLTARCLHATGMGNSLLPGEDHICSMSASATAAQARPLRHARTDADNLKSRPGFLCSDQLQFLSPTKLCNLFTQVPCWSRTKCKQWLWGIWKGKSQNPRSFLSEEGIGKKIWPGSWPTFTQLSGSTWLPYTCGAWLPHCVGPKIRAEQLQIHPCPGDNPYLEVVQRLHFHDWSQGVERQRDINTLVWHQRGVNGQWSAWDDPKAGQEKNRDDDSSTALLERVYEEEMPEVLSQHLFPFCQAWAGSLLPRLPHFFLSCPCCCSRKRSTADNKHHGRYSKQCKAKENQSGGLPDSMHLAQRIHIWKQFYHLHGIRQARASSLSVWLLTIGSYRRKNWSQYQANITKEEHVVYNRAL